MARTKGEDFDCPVCGESVPAGSKSCPECGACEKSGWSDDTYLDGISLPDEGDELDKEFVEEEFGSGRRPRGNYRIWWWVALILLAALLWTFFR